MSQKLDPAYIVSDFELAAINAANEVFLDVRVSGCQFYLGQALQRKVKELELLQLYKTYNNVKKHVRALITLLYTRFPLELWNVSDNRIDSIPRTNNAIEGWHNVFKQLLDLQDTVFIYLFVN
jgi:hypothetical protein